MAALSALVFSLSWWLGLYLLARDPRKPVLVLAAVGLTSFAAVVALDAVRVVSGLHVLSSIEIYLVAVPGIAWFAVLARAVPAVATRGAAAQARSHSSPPWPRWRSSARRWQATSTARAARSLGDVRRRSRCRRSARCCGRCSGRGSRGRWWATSWSRRCSSRSATRSWSSRSGSCPAGLPWRRRDLTSCCSVSRSRCGMRSTKARRCAATCCARSSRPAWWWCCSAGRR